jgi:hypothetical protein
MRRGEGLRNKHKIPGGASHGFEGSFEPNRRNSLIDDLESLITIVEGGGFEEAPGTLGNIKKDPLLIFH